jgi:hypothetical protein
MHTENISFLKLFANLADSNRIFYKQELHLKRTIFEFSYSDSLVQ